MSDGFDTIVTALQDAGFTVESAPVRAVYTVQIDLLIMRYMQLRQGLADTERQLIDALQAQGLQR